MNYDVIVIGSGIGGLTCAAKLSVLGYKVGVFEKNLIPGGYATNFTRKNYNFDVSLHGIGGLEFGGNPHKILSDCNVINEITPLKNDVAYSININGEVILIPNDYNKYKELLMNKFPLYKDGIAKLFITIEKLDQALSKNTFQKNKGLISKLSKENLLLMKFSSKNTYDILKSYVDNEEFIRIFTATWCNYGLPPQELSAIAFFMPWISLHLHGKYYIKGGSQELSNSLVKIIENNGGYISVRSKVKEIIYGDGKAYGIKLENGKDLYSNWVVSNVNPISTTSMLPIGTLPFSESSKIHTHLIGTPLSRLFIGLDCNPSEVNITEDEIYFTSGESHEIDYMMCLNNDYMNSGFILNNYNSMDNMLNDNNNGVITMTFLDNHSYWSDNEETYNQQKRAVMNKMVKRLEHYYPGIIKHISVLELATPKTMERITGNINGAVTGYAQYLNQSGKNRFKSKCSIPNLSFVGVWAYPGGGVEGAIISGYSEANRIHSILVNLD